MASDKAKEASCVAAQSPPLSLPSLSTTSLQASLPLAAPLVPLPRKKVTIIQRRSSPRGQPRPCFQRYGAQWLSCGGSATSSPLSYNRCILGREGCCYCPAPVAFATTTPVMSTDAGGLLSPMLFIEASLILFYATVVSNVRNDI